MAQRSAATDISEQLLLTVAEQLKLPLLHIARQAELAQLQGTANLASIRATADNALQLIDNFLLGVQLKASDFQLELEPVSVSSVLYDAGQQLNGIAKQYDVSLNLNIAGRYGTVMAHREGLQAALVSLGSSLIEALPAGSHEQLNLQLATHRCRYGIVAGLYSTTESIQAAMLERGRQLQGRARQPFAGLTHTSGAGIFIADAILAAMHLELKASRHHGQHGFGIVLPPNHQLQLV
jgi:K+-sensing histidine kinase KdpD